MQKQKLGTIKGIEIKNNTEYIVKLNHYEISDVSGGTKEYEIYVHKPTDSIRNLIPENFLYIFQNFVNGDHGPIKSIPNLSTKYRYGFCLTMQELTRFVTTIKEKQSFLTGEHTHELTV